MGGNPLTAWIPEAIVAGGALAILLAGVVAPRRGGAWHSLVALAALTFALAFQAVAQPPGGPGWAGFLRVVIIFSASLVVFLSHDHLGPRRVPPAEYHVLLLLGTVGMLVTVAAADLLLLFLGIELTSLCFTLLAALVPGSARSKEAALKYLLYGLASSAVLLLGFVVVYGLCGTWDLVEVALAADAGGAGWTTALVLILAGLAFKLGLAPFHLWIPDVYAGCPAPVAAFLAVGPKAAALGATATLLVGVLPGLAGRWEPLVGALALLSMVWGNLGALAQRDLKRLLAWSGVAHAGYLAIGLVAAARLPGEGLASLAFYLFTYVFFSTGMFALAVWREGRDGSGPLLDDLAGLGRRQPWLGAAMTLFLLALAGIPPTAGFMAKLWVFLAAVRAGMTWLAVAGLVTSVLGAFYYLRVARALWLREPAAEPGPVRPGIGVYALALAVLATLWFGVWPGPLLELARLAAR